MQQAGAIIEQKIHKPAGQLQKLSENYTELHSKPIAEPAKQRFQQQKLD
jgi:hypothetical protein